MPRPDTPSGSDLDLTIYSARRPGKPVNEDLAGFHDSCLWVLDGASVPPELPSCCDIDAAWFVRQLDGALSVALSHDHRRPLQEAVHDALVAVSRSHDMRCDPATRTTELAPTSTIALVRLDEEQLDYLVLGDSSILIEKHTGVEHITDRRIKKVAQGLRAAIRDNLATGAGYASDRHRQLVKQLVEAERDTRNTTDGYWIAGADPKAAHQAFTGTLEISEGTLLALATDGVVRAIDDLALYHHSAALLRALTVDGIQPVVDAIRRTEHADRDGRRFPRTSWSDDATAIVARLA